MDTSTLRSVFGRFATGVTVVTCASDDGRPHGATVTAFTPVSLDPPLVQVALTRTTTTSALLHGRPFAVNVLAHDQMALAVHFGGRPGSDPVRWVEGATAPLLADVAATLSCRAWRTDDGGDHLLFLGEVVDARHNHETPLVYHARTYHQLGSPSADVARPEGVLS